MRSHGCGRHDMLYAYIYLEKLHHVPRPLTEILPHSVEVLRLVVNRSDYRVFDQLFGQSPKERDLLPALRKIHLRIREGLEYAKGYVLGKGPEYDGLRESLNAVGIELVVEEFRLPFREVMSECIETWDN
jgi:hypothetical protein